MIKKIVLPILLISFCCIYKIEACKGCVNLDEHSLTKILPHFEAVLVKFDVAFPYGDKHEIFTKVAAELSETKDLIVAEIGIKDYGEKDNEEIAKKYDVSKEDFPAVKLFKKGLDAPISFSSDFSLDNLRTFIRDNTEIYLGLPGCLERFDKLATKFVDAKDNKKVLEEAEKIWKSLQEKEQESAKTYIVIMKKIIESGRKFIALETDRVTKLLKGKISAKKQTELQSKLNILRAFSVPRKDEL